MRQQGKVVSWNDVRGFGFVVQNGQAEKLFLHARAFAHPSRRPNFGDVLTWTAVKDERGRAQACDVEFADAAARRVSKLDRHARGSRSWISTLLTAILFFAIVAVTVNRYWTSERGSTDRAIGTYELSPKRTPTPSAVESSTVTEESFRCEAGKQHCSQMHSCAEATFYVTHCPDTRMDGDHDGRPCEERCGH